MFSLVQLLNVPVLIHIHIHSYIPGKNVMKQKKTFAFLKINLFNSESETNYIHQSTFRTYTHVSPDFDITGHSGKTFTISASKDFVYQIKNKKHFFRSFDSYYNTNYNETLFFTFFIPAHEDWTDL